MTVRVPIPGRGRVLSPSEGSDASSSESVSIPNAAKLPSGSVPGPGSRSGARKRDEDEHRPGGRQETLDREIRFRGFATITPAAWQKESSLMLTISLDYLGRNQRKAEMPLTRLLRELDISLTGHYAAFSRCSNSLLHVIILVPLGGNGLAGHSALDDLVNAGLFLGLLLSLGNGCKYV